MGNDLILEVIHNEEQYETYLGWVDKHLHANPNSLLGKKVEVALVLIEKYEAEHHPIPFPDPIEAIKTRLQDKGWKAKDLVPYIGDKTYVSKILNREKPLTAKMIRQLCIALALPADVLLQAPELA